MKESVAITDREREVLANVFEGRANPAIAARLGISVKTVEKHRQALNKAFRADNPVSLVVNALRLGYLEL